MLTVDEKLSKEVPTHLFQFEEKIFGLVTIPQLLYDATAGTVIWLVWKQPIPYLPRVALCLLGVLLTILVVHVRFGGRSLMDVAYLRLRFLLIPAKAIALSQGQAAAMEKAGQKLRYASVQGSWIPLLSIERGCMVFTDKLVQQSSGDKKGKGKQQSGELKPTRYCSVVEVTGINLHLLAQGEQARIFQAFETFLGGLEFTLQIISHNEPIDIQTFEPLLVQEQQIGKLRKTPRLAALAQTSLRFQRKQIGTCMVIKHYVVVSASANEETMKRADGRPRSGLSILFNLGFLKKKEEALDDHVLAQLGIRAEVVRKGLADIGLQVRLLDDAQLARFYVTCLAPGATITGLENPSAECEPLQVAAVPRLEARDRSRRGAHRDKELAS